jgi:PAS domain-containing protein
MNEVQTLERSALEASIDSLRPGLDVLSLPACILDRELRYLYVNSAYCGHTGRAAAEFSGRRPDEVYEHRPNDERRAQMQRALAGEPVIFNRQVIEGRTRAAGCAPTTSRCACRPASAACWWCWSTCNS